MPQPGNDSTTAPDITPEAAGLVLPGGLAVRECSPGVLLEHHLVPKHLVGRQVRVGWIVDGEAAILVEDLESSGVAPLEAIALDLTHPTGQQHAARYCFEAGLGWSSGAYNVLSKAACGDAFSLDRLHALVLDAAARLGLVAATLEPRTPIRVTFTAHGYCGPEEAREVEVADGFEFRAVRGARCTLNRYPIELPIGCTLKKEMGSRTFSILAADGEVLRVIPEQPPILLEVTHG